MLVAAATYLFPTPIVALFTGLMLLRVVRRGVNGKRASYVGNIILFGSVFAMACAEMVGLVRPPLF